MNISVSVGGSIVNPSLWSIKLKIVRAQVRFPRVSKSRCKA